MSQCAKKFRAASCTFFACSDSLDELGFSPVKLGATLLKAFRLRLGLGQGIHRGLSYQSLALHGCGVHSATINHVNWFELVCNEWRVWCLALDLQGLLAIQPRNFG